MLQGGCSFLRRPSLSFSPSREGCRYVPRPGHCPAPEGGRGGTHKGPVGVISVPEGQRGSCNLRLRCDISECSGCPLPGCLTSTYLESGCVGRAGAGRVVSGAAWPPAAVLRHPEAGLGGPGSRKAATWPVVQEVPHPAFPSRSINSLLRVLWQIRSPRRPLCLGHGRGPRGCSTQPGHPSDQ